MDLESRYAYFSGRIVPIEQAKVSVMTTALNYGTGVFEGIRAYWCEDRGDLLIFRLEKHIERLRRNGKILMMELPVSDAELIEIIIELLRKEAFQTDAYIRPLLFKSGCEICPRVHDNPCDLTVFTSPLGRYVNTSDGITAVVSSWQRMSDTVIPPRGKITGSYVNASLSKSEAQEAGVDEAILLTRDGTVSEASAANLFLVRDGALITPPVHADILEGITRDALVTLAREAGIEVVERLIQRSELYVADEVLLCGTAVEVAPVIEIDHRPVADRAPGPVTQQLAEAFDACVHGRSSIHSSWSTPVGMKKI